MISFNDQDVLNLRILKITNAIESVSIAKYLGYSANFLFSNCIGYSNEDSFHVYTEYIEKGSIQNFLEKGFTNTGRQIIFYGVSQAMTFLHKLNIINGRLKATNVLLNDQFHPILTDYFYNKYYDQYDDNYSLYDAPEITTNNAIRNKKPMFSHLEF